MTMFALKLILLAMQCCSEIRKRPSVDGIGDAEDVRPRGRLPCVSVALLSTHAFHCRVQF